MFEELVILLVILVCLIVATVIVFRVPKYGNKGYLAIKENALKRLDHYDGEHQTSVNVLVSELVDMCDRIAACRYIIDAKEGMIYAEEVTRITQALFHLDFFSNTDHVIKDDDGGYLPSVN